MKYKTRSPLKEMISNYGKFQITVQFILYTLKKNLENCNYHEKVSLKSYPNMEVKNFRKYMTIVKNQTFSHDICLFQVNATICSSFKWIEPLFSELSCTQTDMHIHTQTPRHTDGHEYSVEYSVDKPQL